MAESHFPPVSHHVVDHGTRRGPPLIRFRGRSQQAVRVPIHSARRSGIELWNWPPCLPVEAIEKQTTAPVYHIVLKQVRGPLWQRATRWPRVISRRFPTTSWTMVSAAGRHSSGFADALSKL